MVLCILVLTVCCITLVLENWGTGNLLFDLDLGFIHIGMSIVFFAVLMLGVYHALNAMTIMVMFDFAKGHMRRHVEGIQPNQIVTTASESGRSGDVGLEVETDAQVDHTLSEVCPLQDLLTLYSTCSLFTESRLSDIRRSTLVVPEDATVSDIESRFPRIAGIFCSLVLPPYEEGYSDTEKDVQDDPHCHWLTLPKFPKLASLDFGGVSKLGVIAHLKELETLRVYGESKYEFRIRDLTRLLGLARLRSLQIQNASLDDLSPVALLPNLTALHISGADVSDIIFLSCLPRLQQLDLSSSGVKDVRVLWELRNLRRVSLAGLELPDWNLVFQVTSLTHLDIQKSNIQDIASITKLAVDELWNVDALLDLPPTLRKLNLSNTFISSADSLLPLLGLTHLFLYNTKIDDITQLVSLIHLRALGLSGTAISDITPLLALTELRDIGLSETQVPDPSALFSLPKLHNVFFIQTESRARLLFTEVPKTAKLWTERSLHTRQSCTTADELMLEFEMRGKIRVM
ncbi:hypothetical protein HDU98_008800 [Podochytrium sp. JEL0797]|nr:hypothetical protein HDU98_008800 [Podochytrium sp. JEL0797]